MRFKLFTKICIFGTKRPVFVMFSRWFDFEFELEKQDFRHVIVKKSGR